MTDDTPDRPARTVQRRGFFAALGAGGVAAAAATAGAIVASPTPAEAVTPPGTKGGAHYRESDHIKQFYRVNRY